MHVSQPIDVGSVLSGRYQVTETVLSSAEGDLVLGGIDQVLNRSVSIMVASTDNSSQLAASAREIAMGERASNVQVLDLGITDANQTYLVANVARSSDLLDLVLESDEAPYVEPFFTDTLGTEIFGESRQSVPETYEDDSQYYEQLQYDDEQPEHQRKLGTAFSSGFAGLKHRFGKKNQEQTAEEQFDQTAPNEQIAATTATPVTPTEQPATEGQPAVTRLDDEDDEPNVTATAALAAAAQSKGDAPAAARPEQPQAKSAEKKPEQDPADEEQKPAKKKGGAAIAGAAAAGTAAGAAAKASTFPAAAKNVPAQSAAAPVTDEEEEESSSKGTRLLVGAVLLIVLILAVVFAFNFLGGDKNTTADGPSETTEASQPAETDKAEESTEPTLPKPEISDVSRLVPGNQQLNAETDGTLSNMIDGNASSSYNTYTYTTSNFGGFASNMVFILELEDKSAISEVNLDGLNATGGDYEILVGDSDDLGDAKSVAKGSFSGPSVSVTVKDGDKDSMEGSYVFLNVTDLPRKASGGNESRPYGLQIGEFSAK